MAGSSSGSTPACTSSGSRSDDQIAVSSTHVSGGAVPTSRRGFGQLGKLLGEGEACRGAVSGTDTKVGRQRD